MGMNEERFSIGELAAAAATTPRTIRFYAAEGLLPPPLTEGRNAIYTEVHRRRLRLIQRLKAAYLPLSAIKEQMADLTDDQVDALLERVGPHRVENTGAPHTPKSLALAEPTESSTVAYVAQILAVAEQALTAAPDTEDSPPQKRVLLISPALRPQGETATGKPGERNSTIFASERWERIHLVPGIELHVSESLHEERRAELNQLIQFAHTLFPEQGR